MQLSPLTIEILQAPLKRLLELRLIGVFEDSSQKNYLSILIHYLSGEENELTELLARIPTETDISLLGRLRLQNLLNMEDDDLIRVVEKRSHEASPLSGEFAFALGMTYLRFKRNPEAKEAFQRAYKSLTSQGIHHKAVKALLNVVVAESRIDNRRRLFSDYEVVAKKAKEVGASEVEGICYQNISKELQILGAQEHALKFANLAIGLQEDSTESVHYYETILHRCHLFIELGRFKEAYLDFERAKLSRHPQTIEALKCIERLLGDQKQINTKEVEPAWLSKLSSAQQESEKPTKLEAEFLSRLSTGPVSRNDITLCLYGENTDWESAKNRFKVFLNRFKKKFPNLIVEEDGYFVLVDESVLVGFKEAL